MYKNFKDIFHFDHKDEKLQDTYDMCVYTIYVQYIALNEFAKWPTSCIKYNQRIKYQFWLIKVKCYLP